jgi:nicotinamide riboside transporter PnuC
VFRLDYLSCVLTITSTILVGRRCWEGWVLATVNSVIMCIIGIKTAQLGFIPANIFCIVISVINLRTWRSAAAPCLNHSPSLPVPSTMPRNP